MTRHEGPSTSRPLLLTLDTNQLDPDRIKRLSDTLTVPYELSYATVTARERGVDYLVELHPIPETTIWGESPWGNGVWAGPVPEVFVLGESGLGTAALGADNHVDVFEAALVTISGGSFPKPGRRDGLTSGERRQLRDAMIFEAHVRARRHVLITDDAKGFISEGRREKLQALGQTRILTLNELESTSARGLKSLLGPPI